MARVLIIDDDTMLSHMLSDLVGRMGHEPTIAGSRREGMDYCKTEDFDVVLLDVQLPDGNGLELIPAIRTNGPSPPEVIIITAQGDPDGAELAIKNGAWDYIEKPSSIKRMSLPIMRAVQYREEKRSRTPLKALKRDGIIGSSPQMNHCFDQLAQAASSDAPVLIFGETGTGKELFARAIHENSPRSNGSFVVVDCAALPDTLVESALFGFKKGAFTGADRDADGLIAQADGGTLFLDEIGELPLLLQKAFLRVLQEHRFRPIGAGVEQQSNFRVVAASNRDLRDMASAGSFRNDLLFRLESLTIEVPPLRQRSEDIQELTLYYVDRLCRRYGMETKGVTPEFSDALAAYSWPGNVRELVNTLEWVLSAARNDPTLYPRHLPAALRIQLKRDLLQKETVQEMYDKNPYVSDTLMTLSAYRDRVITGAEKHYLQELRRLAQGDIARACRLSGLSRPRLYALFKKHDMAVRNS